MIGLLAVAIFILNATRTHPEASPGSPARFAEGPASATSPLGTEPFQGNYLGVIVPEESVDISSHFEGMLEQVPVQVGDVVKRGQVLAALDAKAVERELAILDAELLSTRAELKVAELGLVEAAARRRRREDPRQLSLGAISEEEMATARYEHELSEAKRAGALARVKEQEARVAQRRQGLQDAVVRAPFDGVVAHRYLDPGRRVQTGEPILHLLRVGALQVRFAIPEAAARRVAPGREVRIRVEEDSQSLRGRVAHVAPEVDAASRMVLAIALVEDPPTSPRPPSGSVVRVEPTGGN